MAISKKLRFEVFKRDGFQCAYCGRKPPAVVLECDHINPKSKGGKNDINNLITACFDCNRGKGATELKKIPLQLSETMERIKEKEEQFAAYCKYLKKIEKSIIEKINEITDFYEKLNTENHVTFSDLFKHNTLRTFVKKLPPSEIKEAMVITFAKKGLDKMNNDDVWIKYFCGVCWTKIRNNEAPKLGESK